MKVSVLLADKGTANPQGTLNLLNIGWSQTVLHPAPGNMAGLIAGPFAVAAFLDLEPQYCNHQISVVLSLVDEDGHPVEVPGPAGPQAMQVQQMVTVPTPGGGIALSGQAAVMIELIPGLPLAPGGYQWRVSVEGHEERHWSASFRVVSPPQPPIFTLGAIQQPGG